jgi:hypothetical protein
MSSDQGPQGVRGRQGQQGQQGRQGRQGRPGRSLTRVQALSGLTVVALAVALSTYRAEVNARHIRQIIHTQEVTRYEGCLTGVSIIEHFNAKNEALIKVEEDTDFTTALGKDLSRRRIAASCSRSG